MEVSERQSWEQMSGDRWSNDCPVVTLVFPVVRAIATKLGLGGVPSGAPDLADICCFSCEAFDSLPL